MNTKPLAFVIGIVAACYAGLVLPACSSDEDDGTSSTAGTGGSGATGTGGASTGGTGTGTGGSGTGGTASATVTCGSQTCQAGTFPACCAGTAGDKCGLEVPTIGCQEQNQPGDPDQSCTDAFNEALDGGVGAGGGAGAPSFQLEGCCRPEGVCGIIVNFGGLNLGCVDVSQYADGGTVPSCTP